MACAANLRKVLCKDSSPNAKIEPSNTDRVGKSADTPHRAAGRIANRSSVWRLQLHAGGRHVWRERSRKTQRRRIRDVESKADADAARPGWFVPGRHADLRTCPAIIEFAIAARATGRLPDT